MKNMNKEAIIFKNRIKRFDVLAYASMLLVILVVGYPRETSAAPAVKDVVVVNDPLNVAVVNEPVAVTVDEPVDVNVVNIAPEGQKVWFQGVDTHGGPINVLYTVPAGFKFVLTDIIVTPALTSTGGLLGANIANNALSPPTTGVPFNIRYFIDTDILGANITVNLSTGADFKAGDKLIIATAFDGVPTLPTNLLYWIGGTLFADP